MAEWWIENAKTAIKIDAMYAWGMCKDTAEKEHLQIDWVVENFLKEFRKIVAENGINK